jgi:hypothetical protein
LFRGVILDLTPEQSMPHAVYLGIKIFSPWLGCSYQIEMIDFRLETMGDPALYQRVITEWGRFPGCGVIARCPGCKLYVLFGPSDKTIAPDITTTTLPVLADDWYLRVQIG